jgi:hypothetical protein
MTLSHARHPTQRRAALRALALSAALLGAIGLTACQTPLPNAAPHFSLIYRGADGNLHVRWSADGNTWQNPASFPAPQSSANGPGQGGTPNGLSQMAVFRRGTTLLRLSAIGASEYGSSPPDVLESNVSVNSAVSVAFLGSGNWLLAHRSGSDAVLKRWTGSGAPTVITPTPGIANLCVPDNLSGPIGPKAMVLNDRFIVGFCQTDTQGSDTLKFLTGTISPSGQPAFGPVVTFQQQESGLQPARAKTFALGHDGSSFILAIVAADQNPPGPLATFGLLIYASADGSTWQLRTRTGVNTPPIRQSARATPLGVAVMPPRGGSPALTLVAQYAGSALAPRLWAFDGASWSDRSSAGAFGPAPDTGNEFSLRLNSRP